MQLCTLIDFCVYRWSMELVSFVLVLTLTVIVLAVVQDYFVDKNIWYYLLSVSTILLFMILSMVGIQILFRG